MQAYGEFLRQGAAIWNAWRAKQPVTFIPDFMDEDFSGLDLSECNLSGVILLRARLIGTKLVRANLEAALLFEANLTDADLTEANVSVADFVGTILTRTIFTNAKMDLATFD